MQTRDSQFEALLRSDRLDSYALKHACLRGIPDNLRAETWRHLLGIVQLDSAAKGDCAGSGWHAREESKLRHRKQYNELASELLERIAASAPIDPEARRRTPQDVWLDDIDKDVRRTQTSYAFFAQSRLATSPIPDAARRVLFDRLNRLHPHRQEEIEERYSLGASNAEQTEHSPRTSDRHFECLIRLLYVFAALNPVHYVQGMSELVAPLYYVFSTGPSSALAEASNQAQYAEADTFWAFTTLMGVFGDFYVQDSDGHFNESVVDVSLNGLSPQSSPIRHLRVSVQSSPSARSDASEGGKGSTTGLGSTLRRFARQLHWLDGELAHNLHRRKEIQPTFYALRWITCLFAMEFRIPDLVRIWDSLFALLAGKDSASHGSLGDKADGSASQARDFVLDVCCAMVLMKRGELLSGSFAACLGTLQNYLCDDIDALLAIAFSIREKRVAATLTGLEFSHYSSMPNSPAVPGTEDADNEGRFLDSYTGNGPQAAVMTNAKSMLASVASSSAAKGLRQRFWKTRDTSQSHDFPDDVSDLSAATAPAILEGPASAFSPRQRAPPLIPTGQDSSATLRSSTSTAPIAMPTSASTLFNKYASTFSQSDAAAALSKATTNSYIAALGWREAAQPTITKLRSDVEARVTGAAGAAKASIRPPSPNMDPPFTPPTANTGRWLTPEGAAPSGSVGERRGSAGPKPLLLSGSARRASTQLHDGVAAAGITSSGLVPNGTPGSARKASWQAHQQHSSLGLGLPQSSSTSHLESPSVQRFVRSPSPTAGFRPLPSSGSPAHGRGASVSLGTYRIGSGARLANGSTTPKSESYEVTLQPRSSSFAGSLPTTSSTSARLQDVMSASASTSAPVHPLRSLEATGRDTQLLQQGDFSNTSISSDDIPLSQLQLKMASLPAAPGPKSPEQGKTRSRTNESRPFSVLRNRGESNDLEILDDDTMDKDDSHNEGPRIPTPPPVSPSAAYSALDDMPMSPTGGVSLSRHSLRKLRVSSLANVSQDASGQHDGPLSPSTTIRSVALEDPPVSPSSTVAQQPQKVRRKLASSRRTSSRTESASLVESLGSTRSSMDVPSAVLE